MTTDPDPPEGLTEEPALTKEEIQELANAPANPAMAEQLRQYYAKRGGLWGDKKPTKKPDPIL